MLTPGRPADPVPALRALLDVPLRLELAPPARAALTALEARVGAPPAEIVWPDVYRDALSAAEKVAAALDARMQELQRLRMQLGDPATARQRYAGVLRKDLDRARNGARAAVATVQGDWQSRPRRQVDYVMEEVGKQLAQIALREQALPGEIELSLDEGWLARYTTWLRAAIDAWIASSVAGVQRALTQELGPVCESLARAFPDAPPPVAPTLGGVRAEVPAFTAEAKRYERHGFGSALAHYVRGNVMTVSMFGGVVAVLGALAGGHAGSSSNYRNYLIAGAVPLSIGFGVFAVRSDRARGRKKNLDARRVEVATWLKQETGKVAERQRDVIERTLIKRVGDVVPRDLEAWIAEHAEPAIARAEERGGADALELAVRVDKLNEEAGQLRTLNSAVTQQMMIELKKRLRELSGTGTGP